MLGGFGDGVVGAVGASVLGGGDVSGFAPRFADFGMLTVAGVVVELSGEEARRSIDGVHAKAVTTNGPINHVMRRVTDDLRLI